MALDGPERASMDAAWLRYRKAQRHFLLSLGGLFYGLFCGLEPDRFEFLHALGIKILLLLTSWGGFILLIGSAFAIPTTYRSRRSTLKEAIAATDKWVEANRHIPPLHRR